MLDTLHSYTTGDSQADRTAANIALNRFDATAATSNISLAQKMSQTPGMTAGATNVAAAGANRDQAIARSNLSGQLAIAAQDRAYKAVGDFLTQSMAGATLKNTEYQDAVKDAQADYSAAITAAHDSGSMSIADVQAHVSANSAAITDSLLSSTFQPHPSQNGQKQALR